MTLRKATWSIAGIGLVLGLLFLAVGAAGPDKARKKLNVGLELPISGTAAGANNFLGTFAGTLNLQRFQPHNGAVVAIGIVTGSVTGQDGVPAGTGVVGEIALPVTVGPGGHMAAAAAADGSIIIQQACEILTLEIGAVNLDLLGLQVTTLPISINISADSAGVLGNLVCTVLETLNNLVGLLDLLNRILGILGGLIP